MKKAYKRRPQDFKRRILERVDISRGDLLVTEYKWLCLIKNEELGKRYYNLNNHQFAHWTTNEEKKLTVSEKLSKAQKQNFEDPDYRARFMETRKNLPSQSAETKLKRSVSIKAVNEKKFPLEHRKQHLKKGTSEERKMRSEMSKKRWAQPGAKEKQSAISSTQHAGKQYRLGHINTPEHRANISAGLMGHSVSAEARLNMSQARKGKKMSPEFKQARRQQMIDIWAKRRAGILPLPGQGA